MQQIGRNIFSLGLSRITSGLLLFFVYAKLASYLGPAGFGKFYLILAYYTIFLLFVDFGISRYVIKKISEDKNQAPLLFGNFFIAQFFSALIVFSLFIFIPQWFDYDAEVARAMLYVGIGLLFGALSIPFAAIIQAWQKIHLLAAVYFFDSLIRAVWLILSIFWTKDLVFIFFVYVLTGIFDIVIYAILTRKIARPQFQFDRGLTKKLFVYGIPFAFISGFEILIAKVDIVIQKFFLPYHEVGLYSAAYRFLDFLTFVPAVVAISLFPVLSEMADLNTAKTKSIIDRVNRYMLLLAIPLGAGATMFADKIIFTLFGPAYVDSIVPFQILIWSTVITFVYAVSNVVMQVKQTKRAILILALAAVVNAVSNVIFVPRFGIIASAWLTVATYLFVAALYTFYSSRSMYFSYRSYIFWPVFASVLMGAGLWLIRDANILLITLIAMVIYFGVLIISGYVKREDWLFIKSVVTRSP